MATYDIHHAICGICLHEMSALMPEALQHAIADHFAQCHPGVSYGQLSLGNDPEEARRLAKADFDAQHKASG